MARMRERPPPSLPPSPRGGVGGGGSTPVAGGTPTPSAPDGAPPSPSRERGLARYPSITRRLNVWVMLFVVTKPKRISGLLLAVRIWAARSHHCITKSADFGTRGFACHSASVYSLPSASRRYFAPIYGGLPTMNSASGQSGIIG